MKTFAALLLLASVVTAEYVSRTDDEAKQFQRECATELNLSLDHVGDYTKEELSKTCFMKCVAIKLGWFDEGKGLNVENLYQHIQANRFDQDDTDETDETIRAEIVKCADNNEQGSNSCEWAYRTFMCFTKLIN